MKKIAITLSVICLLIATAFIGRFQLLVYGMYLLGPPELETAQAEEPDVRWYDDYYTIHAIDSRTYAIAETRYWQYNFNYLILGDTQAILFDAGPGVRDIWPVVRSLTELPVLFIPSHLHYDHLGRAQNFDQIGLIDLLYLRQRVEQGMLKIETLEHLGLSERIATPTIKVDEWLQSGTQLALGGREITVISTPGHTRDGTSLVDVKSGYVFSGDFLVPGTLAEFLPGGGMGDYLGGIETLLLTAAKTARVFGAHRQIFVDETTAQQRLPELTMDDVADVGQVLGSIRDGKIAGSGYYPVVYPINERVELWANPAWLQNW